MQVTPDNWQPWVDHLQRRKKPLCLWNLFPGKKTSPLLWSEPRESSQDAENLIRQTHGFAQDRKPATDVRELLKDWLNPDNNRPDESYALQCLAWSHVLPALAEPESPEPWQQLFDHLIAVSREAVAIRLEEAPLSQQLLAGELPLTLGYQFPEIDECQDLADESWATLSNALIELLDGNGLPHGKYISSLRPLMACWTRCGWLGRAMKTKGLTVESRAQYDLLVRQAMRLTRHDGGQVFSAESEQKWNKHFINAALELVGDTTDDMIARRALGGSRSGGKSSKKAAKPNKLPSAGYHCEWAAVGVLRSNWSRKSEMLAVNYAGRSLHLELNASKDTIWSGACDPVIRVDGTLLSPQDDYEEVCWYSDQDVDYLELELEYQNEWKVQRQMLLARSDQFLLIADALQGPARARIDYQCTYPSLPDVGVDPAKETREGFLYRDRRLAAVLPLALPEWRAERVDDDLARTDHGLRLAQHRVARRLYAPLFVDLKPSRFEKELTWRRLTIADRLEIQPEDVAAGYRIQVGNAQWLIYRSLAPRENRSVLGQNLSSEFFVGKFLRSGETKELLQVE